MKITLAILGGFFLISGCALFLLLKQTNRDVARQYSQASEEPLVDFAHLFASLIERDIIDGKIDASRFRDSFHEAYEREFVARIYQLEKTEIQTHIYVADENGIVLFDSDGGKREGQDYSEYNDVFLAHQGKYGVRASRTNIDDSQTTVFFIAAPIRDETGKLAGTITVSRPETAMAPFREEARLLLVKRGAIAALIAGILCAAWLYWLLNPIAKLTNHARNIAAGTSAYLPETGRAELRKLSHALEDMRSELEGKHYVENYVQALTHELKSPLAAIRGAAELVHDDRNMPEEKQQRFLSNILSETKRSEDMVRRLVQLSALESQQKLASTETISLPELISAEVDDLKAALEARSLKIRNGQFDDLQIEGDPLMLRLAFRNGMHNAIDFSPQGGSISVRCYQEEDRAVISIQDEGPGIPDYAIDKVFERFYSLKSEATGRKGSGIGLCFVRETMELHGGKAEIVCESGTELKMIFPENLINHG